MPKTAILGTGLSGLVGSKLLADFADRYAFQNLDISHPTSPVDITNAQQVLDAFTQSTAPFVIHAAAFTDVTQAWMQRGDTNGLAYKVNVIGTQNIVAAAEKTKKHVIHISTAYVFNGESETLYTEEDAMSPIEWYGETKAKAEEIVQNSNAKWVIFRIDQPFRSDQFPKLDIVHRIIQGLQNQSLYPQFTNHYFGPTFIDDFVKVLDWAIRTRPTGVYHATAGEKWSDFDFATMINAYINTGSEIKPGDLNEYLKTVNRPYQKNTALNCQKLFAAIDFKMHSVREAVEMVKI